MDEPIKDQEEVLDESVVEGELEKLKRERDEYLNGWQRARADFSNYRREEATRLQETIRFANDSLIRDFIGVLDNFELGLAAMEKQGPVEKGVYMIKAQIEDLLRRNGVEKLVIQIGEQLNPVYAEAIAEGESDSPPGTVIEEIEAGYKLHEKVIRPARVKVAKSKI